MINKDKSAKISIGQTLETKLENINLKNDSFSNSVDPLFKQISILFDSGKNSKMLLNELVKIH